MSIRRALIGLSLMVPLALSACGTSAVPPETGEAPAQQENPEAIIGARNAIAYSLSVIRTIQPTIRSAALLSIYANQFLADGLAVPVSAAMAGVQAQLSLHALPTAENVDDLYSLLEEFGAVLHVDVADLLNRSDDRAKTLDAYSTGFQNIAERSRRRGVDVKEQVSNLKTRVNDQKKIVSGFDKEVKAAVKAKDFASAQDKQKELADAQTELTQTDLQYKEMTNIGNTLDDLLVIADKRINALNSNREILIAGLKVVDVPGVEDLGVLESQMNGSRRTGGFSPFGGL